MVLYGAESNNNKEIKERKKFFTAVGKHYAPCTATVSNDYGVQLEILSAGKTDSDLLSAYPKYEIRAQFEDYAEARGIPPIPPVIQFVITVWPTTEEVANPDPDYPEFEHFNEDLLDSVGDSFGSTDEVGIEYKIPCVCKTEKEFTDFLPYVVTVIDSMKAKMVASLRWCGHPIPADSDDPEEK